MDRPSSPIELWSCNYCCGSSYRDSSSSSSSFRFRRRGRNIFHYLKKTDSKTSLLGAPALCNRQSSHGSSLASSEYYYYYTYYNNVNHPQHQQRRFLEMEKSSYSSSHQSYPSTDLHQQQQQRIIQNLEIERHPSLSALSLASSEIDGTDDDDTNSLTQHDDSEQYDELFYEEEPGLSSSMNDIRNRMLDDFGLVKNCYSSNNKNDNDNCLLDDDDDEQFSYHKSNSDKTRNRHNNGMKERNLSLVEEKKNSNRKSKIKKKPEVRYLDWFYRNGASPEATATNNYNNKTKRGGEGKDTKHRKQKGHSAKHHNTTTVHNCCSAVPPQLLCLTYNNDDSKMNSSHSCSGSDDKNVVSDYELTTNIGREDMDYKNIAHRYLNQCSKDQGNNKNNDSDDNNKRPESLSHYLKSYKKARPYLSQHLSQSSSSNIYKNAVNDDNDDDDKDETYMHSFSLFNFSTPKTNIHDEHVKSYHHHHHHNNDSQNQQVVVEGEGLNVKMEARMKWKESRQQQQQQILEEEEEFDFHVTQHEDTENLNEEDDEDYGFEIILPFYSTIGMMPQDRYHNGSTEITNNGEEKMIQQQQEETPSIFSSSSPIINISPFKFMPGILHDTIAEEEYVEEEGEENNIIDTNDCYPMETLSTFDNEEEEENEISLLDLIQCTRQTEEEETVDPVHMMKQSYNISNIANDERETISSIVSSPPSSTQRRSSSLKSSSSSSFVSSPYEKRKAFVKPLILSSPRGVGEIDSSFHYEKEIDLMSDCNLNAAASDGKQEQFKTSATTTMKQQHWEQHQKQQEIETLSKVKSNIITGARGEKDEFQELKFDDIHCDDDLDKNMLYSTNSTEEQLVVQTISVKKEKCTVRDEKLLFECCVYGDNKISSDKKNDTSSRKDLEVGASSFSFSFASASASTSWTSISNDELIEEKDVTLTSTSQDMDECSI